MVWMYGGDEWGEADKVGMCVRIGGDKEKYLSEVDGTRGSKPYWRWKAGVGMVLNAQGLNVQEGVQRVQNRVN